MAVDDGKCVNGIGRVDEVIFDGVAGMVWTVDNDGEVVICVACTFSFSTAFNNTVNCDVKKL